MRSAVIDALTGQYVDDYAPLFFLELDSDGVVVASNHFSCELTGMALVGMAYRDVFLFGDRIPDLAVIREAPGRVYLLNVGTTACLPETLRTRFFPAGQGTVVFGSLDADETMDLRRELIVLNNQMNTLSRELQKKNHELEQLGRLKNQFLGMAAHDLRKPVSSILAYCEILLDEALPSLDDEQAGFLRTIHAATDLMRSVIDDFLDISMIESGRFDIAPTLTDLAMVVESSCTLLAVLARRKGIELQIMADKGLAPVMVDVPKICQVLNNLIANAIQHSLPDSVVRIALVAEANGLRLSVSDSGPGIGKEEADRLFHPFVRGSNRNGGEPKSTGLGLAISKKIIEAHGGKIGIEPGQQQGTTFFFIIPSSPAR